MAMNKPKRKTYHHGDLKAALLRAALELLDDRGPDGVLLREVARRAGVSHAAPANHFADRRSLLTAVAVELFEGLASKIASVLAEAGGKKVDRVRAFADTVMDFGLTSPNRYKLLWRRDLLDDTDQRLSEVMDRIYGLLISELESGMRYRSHDSHTAAIGLWSLVHGYVSMRIDGNFVMKKDSRSGEPRERATVSLMLKAFG